MRRTPSGFKCEKQAQDRYIDLSNQIEQGNSEPTRMAPSFAPGREVGSQFAL